MASFDEPRELTRSDLQRMNMPLELWPYTLGSILDKDLHDSVHRYISDLRAMFRGRLGLLVFGSAFEAGGVVAAIVAKAVKAAGRTCYWIPIWELRESVRNRVQYDEDKSVMERCKEVDFLVLDGLDEGDKSDRIFSLIDLERLVRWRGERGKLTIVTSRLSLGDLNQDPAFGKLLKGTEHYLYHLFAPDTAIAADEASTEARNKLRGDA